MLMFAGWAWVVRKETKTGAVHHQNCSGFCFKKELKSNVDIRSGNTGECGEAAQAFVQTNLFQRIDFFILTI